MISHHDVIRQESGFTDRQQFSTRSLIKLQIQKIVLRLDRGRLKYHEQ